MPPQRLEIIVAANGYVVMHDYGNGISRREGANLYAFRAIDEVCEHVRSLYVTRIVREEPLDPRFGPTHFPPPGTVPAGTSGEHVGGDSSDSLRSRIDRAMRS